jgi:hypothetical protein
MLTQKQLFLVSKLYVAAGKAGYAFDLARFSNDAAYAFEVMARIAGAPDPALQGLVAEAMVALNGDMPADAADAGSAGGANTGNNATPNQKSATPAKPGDEKKYVGRLR